MTTTPGTPAGQAAAATGERAYLFQVISEPAETPVLLSQRELDMIVDVGANLPAREPREDENLVDFAILETSDGGPFLYHGHEVPEDQITAYVQRGLDHLIGRLVTSLEVNEALLAAEVEQVSEDTETDD